MEKSSVELALYTGLGKDTVNRMLDRSDFTGKFNKISRKYRIDIKFIDDFIECIQNKRKRIDTIKKFANAQAQLYKWRRKLVKQDEVRNEQLRKNKSYEY